MKIYCWCNSASFSRVDLSPFLIICPSDVPGLDPSLGPRNYPSSACPIIAPNRDPSIYILLISILNPILPQRMSQGFIQVPIQVFLQNLSNFHILIMITIQASMFIQVVSQVLVQRLVQ